MNAVGRVALVGFGLGGSVFHAPFIAAERRLDLVAVVTSDPARQADVVARYPGASVLTSFDGLLARIAEIDVVVISTPNAGHTALAEAVLNAGRHVVVDKPVAPSAAEVRGLAELAERVGRQVIPFQNRRWDGDFRTVTALIAAGDLGTLHRLESRYERWQPYLPSGPGRAWKRHAGPGSGNGIIYDLGTHVIDQAVVLFGRPQSVYAEIDIRRPGAEVDDDAFIALLYPGALRVHLWTSAVAADQGPRFRLLGSGGSYVKLGMDVQEAALLAGQAPIGPDWGEESPSAWGQIHAEAGSRPVRTIPGAYQLFYAGLAAYLLDGAAPPVDVADAVLTAEIVDAAQSSARTGLVVALEP
jgi:predicted dehydrogenase